MENEATAKSKAIHARDHMKREQEKNGKHEAAKNKKLAAKEKAARLARLATSRAPNPASINAQVANATKNPTANTSARWRSPDRLRIYHTREGPNRRPSGAGVLAEIRHYQCAGRLLLQKLPFQQFCCEITDRIVYDTSKSNIQIHTRFQKSAIMAL
jgi:hypothetical protein